MDLHFRDRGALKGWRDDFLRAYVTHGAVEAEGGGVELACPPRVEALLYEAMFDVTEWSKIDRCGPQGAPGAEGGGDPSVRGEDLVMGTGCARPAAPGETGQA